MHQDPVTVLYDNTQFEEKVAFSQEDILAEARAVEEALLHLGYKTRRIEIVYGRIDAFFQELLQVREDVVFNLCEDIRGEGVYEAYVVSVMELLKMNYTGSGPLTLGLSLDKSKSQKLLSAHGLPTPRHVVLAREDGHIPFIRMSTRA